MLRKLSILLATLAVRDSNSFATVSSRSRRSVATPIFASTNIGRSHSNKPKVDLLPFLNSSAAADDHLSTTSASTGMDFILREFEKREAKIQKQREQAMAKLTEYEATLGKLQNAKSEYLAASQMAKPPIGGTFSETALRSAVKAFCWRMIAGSVTFVTSLQFSKSITVALQVVGADFFSKSATMFIGERLMNKSQAGRAKGSDVVGRSLTKALVWRLFAICTTLTTAIFISKDLSVASKIASTDAVIKTTLMFLYERVWARIRWGKEYLLEYAI